MVGSGGGVWIVGEGRIPKSNKTTGIGISHPNRLVILFDQIKRGGVILFVWHDSAP